MHKHYYRDVFHIIIAVVINNPIFIEGDTDVDIEVCVTLNFVNPVQRLLQNIAYNLDIDFTPGTASEQV